MQCNLLLKEMQKEINLQAKENYCKSNYRELPTHGKLDTIST